MFHAYGVMQSINLPPVLGSKVILMPRFIPRDFCAFIEKYKVREIATVPPVIVMLAKSELMDEFDLSSIDAVGCGAAPLGSDVQELFIKRMNEKRNGKPPVKMTQGWGMSEVTCSLLGFKADENDLTGGVGYLNPNCEAKLIDEDGKEVTKPNERGELLVRGPNITKGYLNNPEATKETFDGDWLKTGDVALVNEKGVFYIVDRRKELIKHGGFQVAPAELESVLLEHPSIIDAGVIGVEKNGNEYPRAYVVTNDKNLKPKEVADWMSKRVAKFKWLTGGVKFIPEIPKNPSGKILRRELREIAKKEASPSL